MENITIQEDSSKDINNLNHAIDHIQSECKKINRSIQKMNKLMSEYDTTISYFRNQMINYCLSQSADFNNLPQPERDLHHEYYYPDYPLLDFGYLKELDKHLYFAMDDKSKLQCKLDKKLYILRCKKAELSTSAGL